MQIKGTIISVEIDVQVTKNGGGTYPGSRMAYRDETGAVKEKAFHQNVFKFNKELKTQLSNFKTGDIFVAEIEKEGEFWNWKSISLASTPAPVADKDVPATGKTSPYTSPKSTYETPEERQLRREFEIKKQLLIVRQSSFTSAMTLLGAKAKAVSDVIPIADQIVAYIYNEEFDDGMPISMIDDSDKVI